MAESDLLMPWLEVTANVTLGARLRGEAPQLNRAREVLERVGLAQHAAKRPHALSGGLIRREAWLQPFPVARRCEPRLQGRSEG